MKNIILLLVVVLVALNASSQNIEKVKETKEVTWFGLDFTQAKMIGSPKVDFTDPEAIVTRYYEWWNVLFINEAGKYNLSKTFKKKVKNKISIVIEANAKVDPTTIVTYDANELSDEGVISMIEKFKGQGEGMGLFFAIQHFEKASSLIRFNVVFFDIQSGEVLLSQPGVAKPTAGFGFRNFWANGFYNALRDIKKEYPLWGTDDIKK